MTMLSPGIPGPHAYCWHCTRAFDIEDAWTLTDCGFHYTMCSERCARSAANPPPVIRKWRETTSVQTEKKT